MASALPSALAGKALEVVAGLLCRPCIDEFQNSLEGIWLTGSRQWASDEINNWVKEADKILEKHRSSNPTDDQRFCCFFSNARLRCKWQKKIKRLIFQGKRIITSADQQPKRVEDMPEVPPIENDTTPERNLKQVMNMLENDGVWTIGIWGPGGVGKTTLAKNLNNKLDKTSLFSLVIYVSVTKDADLEGMQKVIAKRLGEEQVEEGMDTRNLAERIRNRLQREKFLLIVDNVWEHIDLASIGIPQKQAASKIVLTTRHLEVCRKMEAKPLEIGYLTDEEAWQLFVKKAGEVVNNDEKIKPLAKTVCQECGRLPLAVITVGLAMREKTNVCLWKSAINRLQQANFIRGDESPVNRALKLSYDWLEDDILRFCFLYCSLYPEGYEIDADELVGCWLAEEVIDEQLYYQDAFNEGLVLIEKLTGSCLLEKVSWFDRHGFYSVKMHDVVRDFARWMAEQNRCMIFSGHGISKGPRIKFPEEVNNLERISFVDNKKIELPQHTKDFPKVTTLLLLGTREHKVEVPHEFLEGFEKFRVLNMQYMLSFPGSSLCLSELRAFVLRECNHVEEIPCMPKLIILDLKGSRLHKIPRGLSESTHLKVLNLSFTLDLKSVEVDIISNLTSLEVLDTRWSGYRWPTKRKSKSKEATLQDLSELKELKSVYLDLADVECSYEDCKWMQSLENYYYACGTRADGRAGRGICISNSSKDAEVGSFVLHAEYLFLEDVKNANEIFLNSNSINQSNAKLKRLAMECCTFYGKSSGPAPNCIALSNLETLGLRNHCDEDEVSFSQIANALGTTFPKLRVINVFHWTDNLRPAPPRSRMIKAEYFFSSNDPHMELPKLEEIRLHRFDSMKEVFHYGPTKNQVVAPNLRIMEIQYLPNLERLCDGELTEQWRSLEILDVWECPKLKKLPHMPSIKEIRGQEKWWNDLEWDSPETKSYMTSFFRVKMFRL